jgi:hypothetical protein
MPSILSRVFLSLDQSIHIKIWPQKCCYDNIVTNGDHKEQRVSAMDEVMYYYSGTIVGLIMEAAIIHNHASSLEPFTSEHCFCFALPFTCKLASREWHLSLSLYKLTAFVT